MSGIDDPLRTATSEGGTDLPVLQGSPVGHTTRGHPHGGRPPTAILHPDHETLEIRRALWGIARRKWHVVFVTCLIVVPVAISTALSERLYRASAMVLIAPEPIQVLPYREFDLPTVPPNYEMYMKTEEQILRGTALITRVADRLTSAEEHDAEVLRAELPLLRNRLWLQRIDNTQIFKLGYVASRPEVAAGVANTYAEEYLKLHFDARQQTREKARQQLEAELRDLEAHVRHSDRELVAYAQAHGIPTADNARSLIEEKLAVLSMQLTDAEAQAFAARSRLEPLERASVEQFPDKLLTTVILGLASRLVGLEQEKTALRATFGPNWPAVVQRDKEIALVGEQLTREKSVALDQARHQARLDVQAAENRRRLIAASTATQQQLAGRLETASIQYNIVRGEAEKNRKLYEGVLEQLKKTSLTSGMEFGSFRVVEKAVPPGSVDSPKPLWNLSLAILLGLTIGVTMAFLRNYWDTSITTVDEVEQLADLPVLGTLPLTRPPPPARGLLGWIRLHLPGARPEQRCSPPAQETGGAEPPSGVAVGFSTSPMAAEDVRAICASILLSRSGRPPRSLLVTSAGPGEGKTTVARALSHTLAETGAGTLLVDCDLRRGRLGTMFDVSGDGGLSVYLAGHLRSGPTIHASRHGNLFVVTAGPPAPNPLALLGSERMQSFLRDMVSSFRFVVLDAPPVMPLADTRVLARMVEGVILVVRAGRLPKAMIRRACTLLECSGGAALGAVLNGADDRAPDSPDHYYRRYYNI